MVGPNIGWSNAVPDATANVAFSISGSTLSFTGVGYHDKVTPFSLKEILTLTKFHRTGVISPSPRT